MTAACARCAPCSAPHAGPGGAVTDHSDCSGTADITLSIIDLRRSWRTCCTRGGASARAPAPIMPQAPSFAAADVVRDSFYACLPPPCACAGGSDQQRPCGRARRCPMRVPHALSALLPCLLLTAGARGGTAPPPPAPTSPAAAGRTSPRRATACADPALGVHLR